jgi:hypothetical protein
MINKFQEGDFVEWKFPSKTSKIFLIVEVYPRGIFRRTTKYKCINHLDEYFYFYEGELKLEELKNKKK